MMIRKTFRFEASHLLPKHPGKCSRLHGHSFVLHVETEGRVNKETGFVMDYADMSAAVKPLIERLDHRHLGAWAVYQTDREKPTGDSVNDYRLLAEIWGDDDGYYDNWKVPGLPLDFYPSSENILFWIGEQLATAQFKWSKVALEETCTSYCELRLDEFMVYFTNKYGLPAAQFALAEWR
jgi:6-pyruvoyl tetrahydropterin synthase/QueD family protein